MGIINETGSIKSQCYYGKQKGECCNFVRKGSTINIIHDLDKPFLLVQPNLHCTKHMKRGEKSLIYLHTRREQKLYHNSPDLIINKIKFWTVAPHDATVQNRTSNNKRKHLTHRCLLSMWVNKLKS